MVAQGSQFVFQIAGTVILARLLTPTDFGLVAMVSVIVAFGKLLRDAGLSTAVVQRQTITQGQCSTLFWANVGLSLLLGGCVALAAPAIARFYDQPELTLLVIGLAIPLAIGGLATQHSALLRRNMMFGAMALAQVGHQAAYFVGAVILALLGFGYWSLAGASFFSALADVLLTFFTCRWLPSWPKRGTGAVSLMRFGGDVLGFNVLNYFSTNADNILVGRFLGPNPLGLYSRAYNFFALPMVQVRNPIARVGLPALRLLVDEPGRYRKYFAKIVNIVATLSFPMGMICVVEGAFLIEVLLGDQWVGATPVFRILGAAMMIQPAVATLGLVQLSFGESRRYLVWGCVTAVVYVASFAAGLPWGIAGVAGVYALANYLLLLPSAAYCLARSPVQVRVFLGALVVPFAVSAAAGGLALLTNRLAAPGLLGEGLGLAVFVLVYCGLSLARPSVRATLRLLPWLPQRKKRGGLGS